MSLEPYQIIKAPLLSEESIIHTEAHNQYAFRVVPSASKGQIRDAIEKMFNVQVVSVNTMNYQGKLRRRGRVLGRRPDWKKAVVTLKEGDTIDLLS